VPREIRDLRREGARCAADRFNERVRDEPSPHVQCRRFPTLPRHDGHRTPPHPSRIAPTVPPNEAGKIRTARAAGIYLLTRRCLCKALSGARPKLVYVLGQRQVGSVSKRIRPRLFVFRSNANCQRGIVFGWNRNRLLLFIPLAAWQVSLCAGSRLVAMSRPTGGGSGLQGGKACEDNGWAVGKFGDELQAPSHGLHVAAQG
jgi:hypothetical protein